MIEVDAILFDLDGTLIDSRKDIAASVHHIQTTFNMPLSSEDEIASYIGDGVEKLVQRSLKLKTNHPHIQQAVDMLKKYYSRHCLDHTRPYPHVSHTLHHFQHKKMAVVTNKPMRVTRRILDGLRWTRYFPIVLGGDSVKRKKPAPEGILAALSALRISPCRALMVGDSANDVRAGRHAGVRTCGIVSNIGDARHLYAAHPDFVILNMHVLTRLFN